MTKSEEYRELLIKELKATGNYIAENAENILSKLDYCSSFDLTLHFPSFGDRGFMPTIETHQVYFNDSAAKVYAKKDHQTFKKV